MDPPSLTAESSSLQRRSLSMISQAATEDESETDDTLDYSLFNLKPRLAQRVNLRSSPVSASACDITEAFNKSVCTGSQFQHRFRSRSSSVSVSSTSSAVALGSYATPADIKPTKTRTKSFSPGTGYSPSVLKGKYKLSNHSFRTRSSSVSTFSSSSSSASSSSPPIPTESTEQFWNQYRRQTNTSFMGKLLKTAVSKRQEYCGATRYIAQADAGVEERECSEIEDLYDEMYQDMFQDMYQDIFEEHPLVLKKRHVNCDKRMPYSQNTQIIL